MATTTRPAVAGRLPEPLAEYTRQEFEDWTLRLTALRDDVVAGRHPRLSILPDPGKGKGKLPAAASGLLQRAPPALNGIARPVAPSMPVSQPVHNVTASSRPAALTQPISMPPANAPSAPKGAPYLPSAAPKQFDPIFLAKSDVLVKAESQTKRLRLERALEDQVQKRKAAIKQKTFEQDALPAFDVVDVLRRSRDLVRPFPPRQQYTRGGASPADSFDDNTLYSSQVNSSNATDDTEPSRQQKGTICHLFSQGKRCRFGKTCKYLHLENDNRPHPSDSANSGSQANQTTRGDRPGQVQLEEALPESGSAPVVSQQERIKQLEAELRLIKEGQQKSPEQLTLENRNSQDGSVYSPPGPDEFGRDTSLRDPLQMQQDPHHPAHVSAHNQTAPRSRSPPRNGRIVRNHITSPFAPQPARVSPLAVARGPRTSPGRSFEQGAPSSMSKRKRSQREDLVDQGSRKVLRRQDASPEVRIKEEPESPPPLQPGRSRRMPLAPEYQMPYPEVRRPGSALRSQPTQRPVEYYEPNEVLGQTQPIQRIPSQSNMRLIGEDPDLRRVVSERQLRMPTNRNEIEPGYETRPARAASQLYLGPGPHATERQGSVQLQSTYSPSRPQLLTPRANQSSPAPSQAPTMAPPPRRIFVDQYGQHVDTERQVSVVQHRQPDYEEQNLRSVSARHPIYEDAPRPLSVRQPTYEQTRASSVRPAYEQIRATSLHPSYGQEDLQAPGSRQVYEIDSRASVRPAYEQEQLRASGVREPLYHQNHMSARDYDAPQSVLTSPRYREPSRQNALDDADYDDTYDPRQPAQVIYREAPRPVYYESVHQPRSENVVRLQSVRPTEGQYEGASAYEPLRRASSVRPMQYSEQPRIVQLSGGAQTPGSGIRYVEERPVSQAYGYGGGAAPPRFATEAPGDGVYYTGSQKVYREV